MAIPKLRRLMALETQSRTPDGGGGFAETWVHQGHIWCAVKSARALFQGRGQRAFAGQRLTLITRAEPIGTDARPQIGQRLKEGNRAYVITGVTPYGQSGLYVELTCEEGDPS